MPESVRTLIVGAGPTGLGAGWRMLDLGVEHGLQHDALVLDAAHTPGGLARSFTDDAGFTWDIGGHVVFSHYDTYDRVFAETMGDDFTLNDRESWVRCRGVWVPYPFQNNLRYLPEADAIRCLEDLERAQASGSALDTENFGAFIDAAFGEGITELFMRPYNFKVWAHPPEAMNTTWIGERVAVVDAARARTNLEEGLDDFGWGPNNRFKYPIGGTGDFYTRLAGSLGDLVRTDSRVVRIDAADRVAHLATGERIGYEHLLSAMPLDKLMNEVVSDAPPELARAAAGLAHSSGHFVGVGVRRPCPSTRSWMYFADSDAPFYRVTYLSNYSPRMTPDPETHYSLLCEVSESAHKPVDPETIVEDVIAGLEATGLLEPGEREDIVSVWYRHEPYSYPVPTVQRDGILEAVLPWLDSHGIASRGRFGLWKYEVSNTDHCLMQGVEWADRVLTGADETTIGIRYESQADGRGAAVHGEVKGAVSQRPAVAGSGQPRR